MRSTAALALGLLIGGAAGAGIARIVPPSGSSPGAIPEADGAAATGPTRGEPAPLEARASPSRSPASTVVPFDLAAHGRCALLPVAPGQPRTMEAWFAIVGVLFESGHSDEALAALHAALAAGVPPEAVVPMLALLPDAQRAPLLRWFREEHPEIAVDPWLAATADDAAGDRAAAFAGMLAALAAGKVETAPAAERLARIDPAGASAAIRGIAERDGWNAAARQAVSVGLLRAGLPDLAAPWTRDAESVRAREAGDALQGARRAVAADPNDPDAWGRLARGLEDAGDRAGAIEALRRAAQLDPDLRTLEELARLEPSAALPFLREVAAAHPTSPTLGRLALVELRLGHVAEAVEAMLRLPEDDASEWWQAGSAALAPARCLACLDALLARPHPPDVWMLHFARATALVRLGRGEEAFDEYAIQFAPKAQGTIDPEGLVRLMALADPARAEAWFSQKQEGVEEERAAWARAWAQAFQGRSEALCRLAETIAEGYAPARAILAGFRGGAWLARLEREARTEGAWDQLAEAYALAGRAADAAAAWDRAVDEDPDDVEWAVQRALAR